MSGRTLAFAILVGAAVCCAVFVLSAAMNAPMAWYEPLGATIHLGRRPSSLAIDWYSRTLFANLLGAAAFAVAALWARRRSLQPVAFRLAMGWALLALAFAGGFYAWTLAGRRAPPEPLPPGYQAR